MLRERDGWDTDGPTRIAGLLDRVLLDERRHNLIGTYSSGMIQKTQLAAALVASPHVLLMDEPFRGLDAEATAAALDLIDGFRRDGGLLLVASHTRTLLDAHCDGILDLNTAGASRPAPPPTADIRPRE